MANKGNDNGVGMSVLVTGAHGYVGPLVLRLLADRGIDARVCDPGWFLPAYTGTFPLPRADHRDFRDLGLRELEGLQAIIHLAGYSNDPTGWLCAEDTQELNQRATVRLARLAQEAGVETFVFSSSCSVFGASEAVWVDEDGPTAPLTPYAQSKLEAETALMGLAGPGFRVAVLRGATAFGASPLPRTDLLLNELCAEAACGRPLILNSLGTSWRPFMPVGDFARALVAAALTPPVRSSARPVWNIAPPGMQMTVRDAAMRAARVAGVPDPIFPTGAVADRRSYRVDGRRFPADFPDFEYSTDFEGEIADCLAAFGAIPKLARDLACNRFVRLAALRQAREMVT